MGQGFFGQVAIVTGAGSGIGAALVQQLAAQGARVHAADRDGAAAERVAEGQSQVFAHTVDVTDRAAMEAMVARVVEREGAIDLMFNNAGVGSAGEVRDVGEAEWRRVLEVNLMGVVHGINAVYPKMLDQKRGHIINTASGAGLAPRPGMSAYAAAKHAVVGLSTSLRAEAAGLGVRVSVVCPGYIKTNILESTKFEKIDGQALTKSIPIAPITADACARTILRGVRRNRGIIIVGKTVWLDWLMFRLSPALAIRAAGLRARQFRAHRKE